MSFFVPALAVAFAAFYTWLTIRILNRRERWTKWTLAVSIGISGLYVLSFGPACRLAARDPAADHETLKAAYFPILYIYRYDDDRGITSEVIYWYSSLWTEPVDHITVEFDDVFLGL